MCVGRQSKGQLPCGDVRAVSYLSVVQDLRDIAGDRSFKHVYICFRRRLSPVRGRGGAQDASKKYAHAAGALQGHRINWKGLRGQGLGGGQLGHPAQIHTHHLLRHSALGLPRRLPARALRASPVCTEYSQALTTRPRRLHEGDALVLRAIEIIAYLAPRLWAIENPQTGLLKTRPFMQRLGFVDATYCLYGTPFKKQTRFWTNMLRTLRARQPLRGLGERQARTRRTKGSPENRPALRERSQAVP